MHWLCAGHVFACSAFFAVEVTHTLPLLCITVDLNVRCVFCFIYDIKVLIFKSIVILCSRVYRNVLVHRHPAHQGLDR